jgi:hypothetical protein
MSHTTELFIVAAVWTVVAVFIARTIPNLFARVAVGALLIGIPFWELPYGYYNFAKLCRNEIGLLVIENFPPQEAVCAAYPFVTLHRDLLAAGFSVVETKGFAGDIKRYAIQDGRVVEAPQSVLLSKYCMTFVNNVQLPWRVSRHEVRIMRTQDERLVARQSRFAWGGMWWQEAARPVLGSGGRCSTDPRLPMLALRNGTI